MSTAAVKAAAVFLPSPLGRVAPQGPGEARYTVLLLPHFGEFLLQKPHPTSLRSATFPKGEGFLCIIPADICKKPLTSNVKCATISWYKAVMKTCRGG